MTGKELIVYILQNDLEDKPAFNNGKFVGFLTAEEAAAKLYVGPSTINAYVERGTIPGYELKAGLYIPVTVKL